MLTNANGHMDTIPGTQQVCTDFILNCLVTVTAPNLRKSLMKHDNQHVIYITLDSFQRQRGISVC